LKTAPAFEAALYAGLRLAGPAEAYREPVAQFARHVGVAFQILNDLQDWRADAANKLSTGGDVLGGRPTVLWALALEALDEPGRNELLALVQQPHPGPQVVDQVRAIYERAGVFDKAARLVDKYQQRAEAIADDIQPDELRRLWYYLIDTVLDRPAPEPPPLVAPLIEIALPAVAGRERA
jgi:geranylgeranyl pyrophosphate synthase